MVKKFSIAIALSMYFISCASISIKERNEKKIDNFTLHVSTELDTCYYLTDRIIAFVEIENKKKFLLKIEEDIEITTQYRNYNNNKKPIIQLNIFHNDSLYNHAYTEGRGGMSKIIRLINKPLKTNYMIMFRQLTSKTGIESIPTLDNKIDNKDFGVYTLQALYIHSNDTVFSNSITIHYLE